MSVSSPRVDSEAVQELLAELKNMVTAFRNAKKHLCNIKGSTSSMPLSDEALSSEYDAKAIVSHFAQIKSDVVDALSQFERHIDDQTFKFYELYNVVARWEKDTRNADLLRSGLKRVFRS